LSKSINKNYIGAGRTLSCAPPKLTAASREVNMSYADTINRVMVDDWSEVSEEDRARAAREVVTVCSVAAAAVTVHPIPLIDAALLAPIQILMVQGIGRIHGYQLDKKSILEILSTFGASIVAQNVLLASAKLIPFLGWAVAISMAYALTYAIGEVSHAYFSSGRGLSRREMKDMFERVYREKKAEKQAASKRQASLKDRLTQLRHAYEAGTLSDEEFERKKAEILSEL
jgi:uncharacterized protein (DUF697 family)